MTLKRPAVIVAALAVLAACGSSVSGRGPAGLGTPAGSISPTVSASPTARATATAKDPQGEKSPHDEGDPHEGSISAKYSKENPPPDTFRPADAGDSTTGAGRLRLELRTVPGCAEVGGQIAVTVRSKPGVQVAVLSNVPREDGKLETVDGRTGADGLWHHTLRIPAKLVPGNYDIMAAAADDRGSDGGRSGSWFIIVAEPGGCR